MQIEIINKTKKPAKYKISIFIGIVLIFIFVFIFIIPIKVIGSSMENTIKEGDMYLVNKLEYIFKDPECKDIVLIEAYKGDEKYYIIKRVIGTPGDTIVIENKNVYLNGETLKEEYIKEDVNLALKRIEVKLDDEVFVMGDNRMFSRDSRSEKVGKINVDRIVGKVF